MQVITISYLFLTGYLRSYRPLYSLPSRTCRHDQRVFRLSEINKYVEDPNKFPSNSHLLGDAAYTLHERLMIPFSENGHLTRKQKNYNFCHSSGRIVIERAFGLLKGRFRSLLTVLDMERVDLILQFIIACFVVHNICFLQNDHLQHPIILQSDTSESYNPEQLNSQRKRHSDNAGHIKRNVICDNLIMRHI